MTQFKFSELKPRIEEAIRKRNHEKCYYDHVTNHRYLREGNGKRVGCCDTEDGKLYCDFEPIELVDGFDCGYSVYFDFANSKWTKINIVAIGQHTGQVYTWSLNALLPDLFIDNKV